MDTYDVKILNILQENGRIPMAELGRAINLSTTATKERVKKMQDENIIVGYSAVISPRAIGYDMTAFMTVPVGEIDIAEMGQRLISFDEVTECHKVTGDTCYIIKVVVKDTSHLEQLVDAINAFARTTNTYIALSSLKTNGRVPIE